MSKISAVWIFLVTALAAFMVSAPTFSLVTEYCHPLYHGAPLSPIQFWEPCLMAGVHTFIPGLWRIATTELLREARPSLMKVFLLVWWMASYLDPSWDMVRAWVSKSYILNPLSTVTSLSHQITSSSVFETSHFLLAGVRGSREYGGKTCKTNFTCSQCSKFLLNTFIHTLFLGTTARGNKQSLQVLSESGSREVGIAV